MQCISGRMTIAPAEPHRSDGWGWYRAPRTQVKVADDPGDWQSPRKLG